MSKRMKFEELTEKEKAAFHNMSDRDLFSLHDSLKLILRKDLCTPKEEVCVGCAIKSLTVKKVGWGGPMACSLIMLEAASRGRYLPLTAMEEVGCDQCGRMIHPGMRYVRVPQLGYRTLNFCMKCVRRSQP